MGAPLGIKFHKKLLCFLGSLINQIVHTIPIQFEHNQSCIVKSKTLVLEGFMLLCIQIVQSTRPITFQALPNIF